MILLELTIYPLDKGESVGTYVARCLEIIDASGLDYQCHSMGTSIEGEFDELMALVKRCFDALAADCHRIEVLMRMDYRHARQGRLRSKVQSVEHTLGRTLKK